MIKVLIKRIGGKVTSIEIKGHANSAPHGEDLVCAGVSSVVTGCLNSLNDKNNFNIKLEGGYASLEAINKVSSHDEVVIETLITSLQTIKECSGQYIEIKNI